MQRLCTLISCRCVGELMHNARLTMKKYPLHCQTLKFILIYLQVQQWRFVWWKPSCWNVALVNKLSLFSSLDATCTFPRLFNRFYHKDGDNSSKHFVNLMKNTPLRTTTTTIINNLYNWSSFGKCCTLILVIKKTTTKTKTSLISRQQQ